MSPLRILARFSRISRNYISTLGELINAVIWMYLINKQTAVEWEGDNSKWIFNVNRIPKSLFWFWHNRRFSLFLHHPLWKWLCKHYFQRIPVWTFSFKYINMDAKNHQSKKESKISTEDCRCCLLADTLFGLAFHLTRTLIWTLFC